MTYDEKVRFLSGYEKTCTKLRILASLYKGQSEKIEELRTGKMFPSVTLDGMPHSGTVTDGMSGYAARISAMEEELLIIGMRWQQVAAAAKDEFRKVYMNVSGDQLLEYRFLHFYSYRKIAEKLGISEASVRRKLHRTIKTMKIACPENRPDRRENE